MKVRINFNNSLLSLLIYGLSGLCLFFCHQELQSIAQILLMFIDSISFLLIVVLENILLKFSLVIRPPTYNSKKIITFSKITAIQRIKPLQEKCAFVFIIVLGILTTIISSLSYYFIYLSISGFICVFALINILYSWIVLRIWFKWKMHRHHVLGIGVLLIGLIISFIKINEITVVLKYTFMLSEIYMIGTLIGIPILISSREIIEKYTMDSLFFSHYRILFYEGIVLFVLSCISFGVTQVFYCQEITEYFTITMFCKRSELSKIKDNLLSLFGYHTIESLYAWMFIIATIISNVFRLSINKTQGPNTRYAIDLLIFILYSFFSSIFYMNDKFDWIQSLCLIFSILGSLIYNENVEIDFFNLSKNTKAEITRRAQKDIDITLAEKMNIDLVDNE